MKYTYFLLFSGTLAAPQTLNGWQLNCQVNGNLGEDNNYAGGPYDLAITGNPGSYQILYSTHDRSYGNVNKIGGTIGANSNNLCQNAQNTTTELLYNDILDWPNSVSFVPQEVFGGNNYILVADGTASFGRQDGCLAVININTSTFPVGVNNIKFITPGCGYNGGVRKTQWFYVQAKWYDMDNDGDLDLLAPRASGLSGNTDTDESEFDWWQNPGTGFDTDTTSVWEHFYIPASRNVADLFFDIMTYGPDNTLYMVFGGFKSNELLILYSNDWTRTNNINSQIVATDGFYSSVQFADLNADGVPDVLATTSSVNRNYPSLISYYGISAGSSWICSNTKNLIYSGFPTFNSQGVSSPGQARAFHYKTNFDATNDIPSIIVSGHNDGYVYISDPVYNTRASFNGQYQTNIIFESEMFNPFWTFSTAPTVGVPVILDFDNDGCNEFAIPGAGTGMIYFLDSPVGYC